MKQIMFKAMMFALPLTLAVPASAAPPPEDEGEIAEPSDEEALQDDILMVIDLPIAADEARTVGIEEAEITVALTVAEQAAVSPGDMTEVLDEESEQVKANGKRKAFGMWVKLQIAEGVRGRELATKIKERKQELDEMSDEQKRELEAKIAALGKQHRAKRKQLHAKRKQLRDEGKAVTLIGKERHAKMVAKANKRHAKAKAAWAKAKGSRKAAKHEAKLDDKQAKIDQRREAAAGDPDKQAKLDKHQEKLDEKVEKREAKLEKRDEKAEKQGGKPGKPGKPGKKGAP